MAIYGFGEKTEMMVLTVCGFCWYVVKNQLRSVQVSGPPAEAESLGALMDEFIGTGVSP